MDRCSDWEDGKGGLKVFGRVFRMEMKRGCSLFRVSVTSLVLLVLLLISCWQDYLLTERFTAMLGEESGVGSGNILEDILYFSRFTVLAVLILAGLHTASFSKDDSSKYLRMILARTDLTTYTQCRFLSNVTAICLACLISFYLFVILLLPALPIVDESYTAVSDPYHYELIMRAPLLFVGMQALQLGMIASACSSVGLMYSVYHPNAFVSICLSGFVFYILISFFNSSRVPQAFNVQYMLAMGPCLGGELSWYVNYAWGLLLPASVVGVCGILFYRRMRWRVEHGNI